MLSDAFEQIGDVQVAADQPTEYLFDGPVASLPTPPQFSDEQRFGHCDVWKDWVARDERFYSASPGGEIAAVSGMTDQVAIVDYDVELYSRKRLGDEATRVRCNHGGNGRDPLYILTFNTQKKEAVLRDLSSAADSAQKMPPASVNLEPNEYQGIPLQIASRPNHLYSGRVIVTVVINGKRDYLGFGTPEAPFKWVGSDWSGRASVYDSLVHWAWDLDRQRWVKEYSPFG